MPPHSSTMASRLKDFIRINPPMFIGSKADEEHQGFLDEVYKILFSMDVTQQEKAELAAYQLKDAEQNSYTLEG